VIARSSSRHCTESALFNIDIVIRYLSSTHPDQLVDGNDC
jgi:hypothetical protein